MKLFPSLSDELAEWAQQQPVFFTGSAPTHGAHINVSPKGLAESHFAVLGPNRCAYIDRSGSGCETISHAYENGRICLMFMSFGSTPRIMRLYCRADVVEWDQPQFPSLCRQIAKGRRADFDGARSVIVCDIWQVQTSCGFGVPRVKKAIYAPHPDGNSLNSSLGLGGRAKLGELAVFEERPTLDRASKAIAEEAKMREEHRKNSVVSLDGLPALRSARRSVGQTMWLVDALAKLRNIWAEKAAMLSGVFLAVPLYFIGIRLRALARGILTV